MTGHQVMHHRRLKGPDSGRIAGFLNQSVDKVREHFKVLMVRRMDDTGRSDSLRITISIVKIPRTSRKAG